MNPKKATRLVGHLPGPLEITTRFVRDRLTATSWRDRTYIEDLIVLERILRRGGPANWTEAVMLGRLRRLYPVESSCIVREIEVGLYTSPKEFWRLQRLHQAKEVRRRKELEEEKSAELEEERKRWLDAGGKP